MVIAIDFDGTIVREVFPDIGEEIPGAIEVLKRLQKAGHFIILWTCREEQGLADALEFLRLRGFVPDAVNNHHPELEKAFTKKYPEYREGSRKVWAHIYIDDKHLGGIPSWYEMEDMINRKTKEENGKEVIDMACKPKKGKGGGKKK